MITIYSAPQLQTQIMTIIIAIESYPPTKSRTDDCSNLDELFVFT